MGFVLPKEDGGEGGEDFSDFQLRRINLRKVDNTFNLQIEKSAHR